MEQVNMTEQIKLLIELQGYDKEIYRLNRELAAVPDRLKKLDEELKAKESITKGAEDELKKLQLAHKDKEGQLKTKEESVKKLQTQLYQIKTNKEYTAMETEISGTRADCSLLEDEIIGLLDKIEQAEKHKAEKQEELKAEQQKVQDQKKKVNDEKKRMEDELKNFRSQRDTLSQKVDKTILSKYERILHGKDGLALVPVINEACNGCFLDLPPQVINEIKMKQDLVFCESCARILYIDE